VSISTSVRQTIQPTARKQEYSGRPLWLMATGRREPRFLVRTGLKVLAVGRHDVLRDIEAVAWVSQDNEVIVTAFAPVVEVGREILVRTWSARKEAASRSARFKRRGESAIATANFGVWDGDATAGIALFALNRPGEEQ